MAERSAKGYGVKEFGRPDPITPETKFQAASISKPVAAMAALKKVDVPAKLVVVKNAAHGFAPNGGTPDPSRAELSTMIADFFDQYMAKKP